MAIVYNSAPDAESTASTIAATNSVQCKAYKCNISDMQAVNAMVDSVVADFGGLDIMVANAGVAYDFPAEDCTPDLLAQTMRVNFDGSFWCARKAAEVWKKTDTFGNVIFTTSMSATIVNVPDKQAVASVIGSAESMLRFWDKRTDIMTVLVQCVQGRTSPSCKKPVNRVVGHLQSQLHQPRVYIHRND